MEKKLDELDLKNPVPAEIENKIGDMKELLRIAEEVRRLRLEGIERMKNENK